MSLENPNQQEGVERQEHEPRYIGRITLLRHGQTEYTNIYPDLTEEGVETVKKAAEQIALNLKEEEEVMMMASDKARARGTADIVKEVLEHDKEIRTIPGITSMTMRNPEKAMEMINEYLTQGGVPAVDLAYTHDARFDDAEIWEPRNEIQRRFFTNLEYAIRAFKRVVKHESLPKPHLIAVTHFEVLSPFLQEVFEFKHPEEPTLKNAEPVEIKINDPSEENQNSEVVWLEVRFRNESQTVGFDRKNRRLLKIE